MSDDRFRFGAPLRCKLLPSGQRVSAIDVERGLITMENA